MIRRSGVRPAVAASKAARETPRRSASGHSPARQLRKLRAAARIASAVMVGWPDEPDSPLHSGAALAGAGATGGVTAPVLWPGVNSERSKPCPSAGPASAPLVNAAAPKRRMDRKISPSCQALDAQAF